MTELKPTNLIAIEVPTSAGFFIADNKDSCLSYDKDINTELARFDAIAIHFPFKIIGEVTKGSISFDVANYTDKYNDGSYRDYKTRKSFYPDNTTIDICLTPQESFFSLLLANGLFFVNRMECPDVETRFNSKYQEWEKLEDNIIKGKLLIIQKLT